MKEKNSLGMIIEGLFSVAEAVVLTIQRKKLTALYIDYLIILLSQLQMLRSLLQSFSRLKLEDLQLLKTKMELRKIHLDLQLLLSKEFVFSNDLKQVWLSQTLFELKNKY
ncbi:hypothetical protein J9317_07060 [Metabacillus sp. KIGAM252]|uniref:Uncharacterized protein n=1 Tax=Metabacillus flavus TaxID=2823519 RepID=A0ABS5LCP5_9BACI|nr:hypothetical protein [Metabacillus flavus]MBS2968515.1 hypothetical protein [Metabacillus flavus]